MHSLSEETNSLTGESTSKLMEDTVVKSSPSKDRNAEDTISSSSDYSSSSEEDTSSNDSESESSSEEEVTNTNNGISRTKMAKPTHPLASKPTIKEMGGISRAQILENVKKESIEDEEEDINFQGIEQVQRKYDHQPADLSLAFIGCDNEGQFDQNIKPNLLPPPVLPTQQTVNVNPRVASNNVRRKTSSLSQRYGAIRRSTSRGSAAIEEDDMNNGRDSASGNTSTKNKSLELDDIQLDEYIQTTNPSGNSFSTKPQSPKFLRPQNKVILGDSSDNVSILTDGML